jgi:protein disulfide-isomerase A6
LASPSLGPAKLDELKVKANILSSFAATKAEELTEAAHELYDDAVDAAKKAPGQAAEGIDNFVKYVEEQAGIKKDEL